MEKNNKNLKHITYSLEINEKGKEAINTLEQKIEKFLELLKETEKRYCLLKSDIDIFRDSIKTFIDIEKTR